MVRHGADGSHSIRRQLSKVAITSSSKCQTSNVRPLTSVRSSGSFCPERLLPHIIALHFFRRSCSVCPLWSTEMIQLTASIYDSGEKPFLWTEPHKLESA